MSARSLALVLLLLPVACAGGFSPRPPASAATFPPPRTDEEIDRRLQFLEQRLDDGHLHAAAWYWGWLGFEGFGAGQGIASAVSESDANDRGAAIVNATKSAVGVADILVLRPMPVRNGAAPVRGPADATHDEKLARLERGEAVLRAAADRARARKSWPVHVGNFLFNAAGSAILLGLGHENAAWTTFATGFVGGEAQIWSEPWRGRRDLEDYEKLVGTGTLSLGDPAPTWSAVATGSGVAVELRF